jgi:hypothetical protein
MLVDRMQLASQLAMQFAAAALLAAGSAAPAAAQEPAPARQIAGAVLPLPDSMRAGAGVLGYRAGELVQLRAGTNGMICLADDPRAKGFQASCYHESLEPFMARGRALRAAGVTERHAVDSVRLAEVKAGRLAMPKSAAVLSSVFSDADDFDPLAGPPPGKRALHVIYLPYATEASSGISAVPGAGRPWLMYAGLPWAHVMLQF